MWFIDILRIGILGENIKVDDIVIKKKKNFDKLYICKRIEILFINLLFFYLDVFL